jgi:hypothetical protein
VGKGVETEPEREQAVRIRRMIFFPIVLVACLASSVAGSGGCGECAAADPCSRADLVGQLCVPNTATVVQAVPCDPNNAALSNRGWYCKPNTGTVFVLNADFINSNLLFMRPAVPAGADPGALIVDPDYTVMQSVPCDPNNPSVAGKWCEPNTANVVEQCQPCGSIGLTCRPERGGFRIVKICMNVGASASLDINRWVVQGPNYTFLFLPPHHLASKPPPTTDGIAGMPEWLFIVSITMGVLTLAEMATTGIILALDTAPAVIAGIGGQIGLEVESELSGALSVLEQDISDEVTFRPGAVGFEWQILVCDNDGNVLGTQNPGSINIHKSNVAGIKLSNGFEIRW